MAAMLRASDTRDKVCGLPYIFNLLTVHRAQRSCGSLLLHYCECNISPLYIRTSHILHRCNTVPEELMGRESKVPG